MASPPSNILLIRPSALGDVARTVPVLVALRQAYPGASIDWLVQQGFEDVVRAHPALSGVVLFPRREFGRWLSGLRLGALRSYLRSLRDRRYDLVIDAQGLARSALLAWCSRAPVRVGHADARELGWLAYTRRVPAPASPHPHTVDRMLSLVAPGAGAEPGDMRLYTPPEARGFARALAPLNAGPYAVLAPTSRWASKQWPDDRFAAVARALASRGVPVVLVGAESERGQVPACIDAASKDPAVVDLLGKTSVAQLMDLVEHASLVLANDSAALHIAVGFDRPLVALFGPTRVERVGPYRRERDVIRHVPPGETLDHKDPRSRSLMERISVGEVVEACLARLGG